MQSCGTRFDRTPSRTRPIHSAHAHVGEGAAGRHRTRSFSVSSQRAEAGAANPSLRLDPPHSPSEPPSGVHDGALALAPAAAQAIDLLQSQRTQHRPPRVRGWPEGSRAAVSPVGRARRRTRKPGRSVARVPLSQSFSPEPQCCRNAQEYTRTLALSQRADKQRVQGIGGRIGREGRGSPTCQFIPRADGCTQARPGSA